MRNRILCMILGAVAGCGDRNPNAQSTITASSSNIADDLADEYDLGEYAIRPPKSFELKSDDRLPKRLGRSIVWRSADDRRGFTVTLIQVPAGEGPGTPELVRELSRSTGMTNYVETRPKPVMLAGLEFERCSAEYTLRNVDKNHAMITYSHAKGQKGIVITFTAPVGEDEELARIADVAARSFRKP